MKKSEKWHVGQHVRWKTVDEVPAGEAWFVFTQAREYPGTLTVARLVKLPKWSGDDVRMHLSHNGEVIRGGTDNKLISPFSPHWLVPC